MDSFKGVKTTLGMRRSIQRKSKLAGIQTISEKVLMAGRFSGLLRSELVHSHSRRYFLGCK
jgi:hypothetical protein